MKKALYFIAISAFSFIGVFSGTAHAAIPSQYYMVLMQEQAPQNCTARHSDLGLGGGVFVAGTSFCEDQSPTMMMLIGGFDDSYEDDYSYDNEDSDDYYDEDEYEDEYDDSDEDEEYEEDYDDSDNDSGDNDSGSHSW